MMKNDRKTRRTFLRMATVFGALSVAGLGTGCSQYIDEPKLVAPMIMDEAERTLRHFRTIPELAVIDEHLENAAGVLIFPRMVKGGVIAGIESGTGVLLARNGTTWSYPAFYLLSAGSIGLQIGLQETEVIMVIRNLDALNSVISHQGKIGADMGMMVGWQGIGVEGGMTTSLGADIIAFAGPGFGLFSGASIEGAALVRRNDLNEYYYGAEADPQSIVMEGRFSNSAADKLRKALGSP